MTHGTAPCTCGPGAEATIRTLREAMARALERTQVGDAEEASAILEQYVTLTATPISERSSQDKLAHVDLLDHRLRLVIKAALGHLDHLKDEALDLVPLAPDESPRFMWCLIHGPLSRWDTEPLSSMPVCPDCGRDLDHKPTSDR